MPFNSKIIHADYDTIACMSAVVVDEVVRSRRKTLALVVQPNGRLVRNGARTTTLPFGWTTNASAIGLKKHARFKWTGEKIIQFVNLCRVKYSGIWVNNTRCS